MSGRIPVELEGILHVDGMNGRIPVDFVEAGEMDRMSGKIPVELSGTLHVDRMSGRIPVNFGIRAETEIR
ncbi:hypothetical protein C2I18_26280 [Paenibacillus sp. PK3_47]|uniref:hypothetical protein n=1 Tax=Paenibacillus sp. PK3_47 TaxID=2072642 RepID=UPI00201DFC62|nr:hypothetical protein [Paenibacillus sp. PK3_47]UQZ36730.1 hypothetical protein C2I18_26280 [Paenibacillus sp. PK3_47]